MRREITIEHNTDEAFFVPRCRLMLRVLKTLTFSYSRACRHKKHTPKLILVHPTSPTCSTPLPCPH